MVTSRTSIARPSFAARWFRDRVRARLVPGTSASTDKHRSRTTGAGLGLAALVVLTTCAVAWVSMWWVPAYLALMGLIFVTPAGRDQPARVSEQGEKSIGVILTDLGQGLRVDRADEADHHHLAAESMSGPGACESTIESAGFNPDSTSSGTTKSRRARSRGRKAAKTAAESVFDTAAVTWIRVGPGKFVRADATSRAIDQFQIEEVVAAVPPATDVSADTPPVSLAPAEVLVEQGPLNSSELIPGDDEMVVASDDHVPELVTEEYGITPSAFVPVPPASVSVEGLKDDVSDLTLAPEADSSLVANLGGNTSWHGKSPRRLGSQRGTSGNRVCWVRRGIAAAIPHGDRASLRYDVRKVPKPRTLVWSSFLPNARVHQATCRAFGRIPHVQRTLRPRSPPCR